MHCDMLKIQDGVAIVEKLNYKRIEAASGNEPRNKLNKSNGGQI